MPTGHIHRAEVLRSKAAALSAFYKTMLNRRLVHVLSALYETLIHAQPPPSCGPVYGADLRVSVAAADLHLS